MRFATESSDALEAAVLAGMPILLLSAGQVGATMIHECAGMQGSLTGTTFEGYVLDNDLLGAILRTVKGIEVSEDTLNFEVIRETVMGVGH